VGSSLRLHAQMWASPIFYFKHTRLCIVCWCLRLKAFELWE
jgi:mevalonate pyrophosphate decarboxylase